MNSKKNCLEMNGITVFYPHNALIANDKVDFRVEEGEIHALVGENGAGKTTLMKVLFGMVTPLEGTIRYRGNEVVIHNSHQASLMGIGMVQQQFTLIPGFTVARNVVIGKEPRTFGVFSNYKRSLLEVGELIREHHFSLDARALVSSLSVGQRQQVEILKLLYRKADLLILDEPTAVLAEQEVHGFFRTLNELKARGKTIILITHKLAEVMEISDRVSVMREGKLEAVRETSLTDRKELARLMVGAPVLFDIHRDPFSPGSPVFSMEEVTLRHRNQERPLLNSVSFQVREGEILGVTAVAGNGLAELEDAASGLAAVVRGRILLDGEDMVCCGGSSERRMHIAYVPADRLHRGSSLASPLAENLLVTGHHRFVNRLGLFRREDSREFVKTLIRDFGIHGRPELPIGHLSGGNIQKSVLAREITRAGRFILFAEPAWGLDIAASTFIYKRILELRRQGTAVLLLSSNLDEILGIADTLVILYQGKVTARLSNHPKQDKELLGEYMLGLRDDFPDSGGIHA